MVTAWLAAHINVSYSTLSLWRFRKVSRDCIPRIIPLQSVGCFSEESLKEVLDQSIHRNERYFFGHVGSFENVWGEINEITERWESKTGVSNRLQLIDKSTSVLSKDRKDAAGIRILAEMGYSSSWYLYYSVQQGSGDVKKTYSTWISLKLSCYTEIFSHRPGWGNRNSETSMPCGRG